MKNRASMYREDQARTAHERLAFPIALTSFVGREQEIAAVCALLRQPEIRLLTLIGPGGVGKTRMALQVALTLANALDDQVCWLSLEEMADPQQILPSIALALGVPQRGSQPLLHRLQASLQDQPLLLLLDNVGQIPDAAAALARLLEACPGLTILATSRACLHLSGEQTFCVPPLALPDLAQLPDKDLLGQYSAITLFVERATAVLPDFCLTQDNAPLVAEICQHLDGLPLAIELAVPRLKVLSLHTLRQRLAHRFSLLTQGMRDTPVRHQTLQNNLEWSYRLLTLREQRLFRFLSVFAGGCTLQTLETAWELAGHPHEPKTLLEEVTSLLEKSLLCGETQEAQEPRLSLLRSMREYGVHRLTLTGELEEAQWAHATYYLELAEKAESQLQGSQLRCWLDLLQREHENLREALGFLLAQAEQGASQAEQMALRLLTALERFWIIGGHVQEGRALLERALKSREGGSAALRGQGLFLLATLARWGGDVSAAWEAGQQSLSLFRTLGDLGGLAGSLALVGSLAWMRGDPRAARTSYEESLQITHGPASGQARTSTLYGLASLALWQRDVRLARRLIEQGQHLCTQRGDPYHLALALHLLGEVSLRQEDLTAARGLQQESLRACTQLGDQRGMASALGALGEIAFQLGDCEQASHCTLESLAILLRLQDRWGLAQSLEKLASVAVAQGEEIWAVQLWSVAQALRRAMGITRTLPDEQETRKQALGALREVLGEQAFAAAWAAGQGLTPHQVVAAPRSCTQATPVSLSQRPPVMRLLPSRGLHEDLTPREREVLHLVVLGLTDAQIAVHLGISTRTVNFHVSSIYRKLEVSSRSAATRYALEHRLF